MIHLRSRTGGATLLLFFALLLLPLLARTHPATAHEIRPAYLELRQTTSDTYDVLWKVPGRGQDLRLGLYVELPPGTTRVTEPRASMADGAFTERWTIKSPGLVGRTIRIDGLAATRTDVLARIERLDGTAQVTRLMPSSPSFVVEAAPSVLEVAHTYLVLGIEHILGGIDHLLFVLALMIITRGGRKLILAVTAFTLSHSVTLSAAALGFVHVPPPPVEAIIALSIVFVAAEIIHLHRGRERVASRAPWVVAFTFGFMHGLGFAGGLSRAGLPEGHIPTALLFFSLGVETGHLLFIAAVLALIAIVRRTRLPAPDWTRYLPPYAIGSVAMFWLVQRLLAL